RTTIRGGGENRGKRSTFGRLVLQFRYDARGNLRAYTRRGRHRLLVVERDGPGEIGWRERAEHAESDTRADALHAKQQTEPVPLPVAFEADEADCFIAYLRFNGKRDRAARCGKRPESAARAGDVIADTADIDDDPIL